MLIQINAEYFIGSHISTRLQYNWLMMNKPIQVDCRVRLADLEPPFCFRIIYKDLSSLAWLLLPNCTKPLACDYRNTGIVKKNTIMTCRIDKTVIKTMAVLYASETLNWKFIKWDDKKMVDTTYKKKWNKNQILWTSQHFPLDQEHPSFILIN